MCARVHKAYLVNPKSNTVQKSCLVIPEMTTSECFWTNLLNTMDLHSAKPVDGVKGGNTSCVIRRYTYWILYNTLQQLANTDINQFLKLFSGQ